MNTKDVLITDYTDLRFQFAFRAYFRELEVTVRDWLGLFREMNREKDSHAILRLTEEGSVVGFIQIQPVPVSAGFFETKWGFIREFWISPEHRGQGHGSALLALAEERLRREGCGAAVLTTDTAPAFYEARGYRRDPAIRARNEMDVYLKQL